MALPCVLFSSSSDDFAAKDFVKQILQVTELPDPELTTAETKSYRWSIDTKYYRTTIHLCTTESRTIGDKEFAESVEAFVHYFDPAMPSSFQLATAWLPYLNHIEPQVQMLVCKTAKDSDAVGRKSTLAWCIENGFELVELEPEVESDDEDDDFPETKGLARIIQALHAHTWPNLELKDSPPVQSPLVRQMMKEQHLRNKEIEKQTLNCEAEKLSNLSSNTADRQCQNSNTTDSSHSPSLIQTQHQGTHTKTDSQASGTDSISALNSTAPKSATKSSTEAGTQPLDDIDWSAFIGAAADSGGKHSELGDGDKSVDEFEQLFMKLKVMKDEAEKMPPSERKKYAEKVALSFWNAIGGDEDEIGDLSGDSD